MSSLILSVATRFMLPLLLLFSLFLLLRGHNDPGGGFSGGLVAASAFVLYVFAFGVEQARHAIGIDPRTLIGAGILVSLASGFAPLLLGKPFLTGLWGELFVPGFGTFAIGSPLFFDIGVFLVVIGIVTVIIFTLAEE